MSTKRCQLVLLALLCLLGGCFDVSDEVWWNPDGSAHLRRTIRLAPTSPTAATPEAAKARADAILEKAEFARIDIRKDPRVKSFDVRTSVEGADVLVVEELDVTDAKDLTAVQKRIAAAVSVDGQTFEWTPALAFEKQPNGNVKVLASLGDIKPPASFDKEQAKAIFGDRSWTLRVYGPSIASAAPTPSLLQGGHVEWKTPLVELARAEVKETELLAELGPPFPALAASIAGGVVLLVIVGFVFVRHLRRQAELAAERPLRAPAPRTMPTVNESGAIEIPTVASNEALLSDASEINVDPADEVTAATPPAAGTPAAPAGPAAPPPIVAAQANADAVIKFKCPKCQVELKIPLTLAGKQGKCRKCQGAFVAPVPTQLKQVRAAVAAAPVTQSASSLRDVFSVKKVKCSCGMTSAIMKGRDGGERCPACNQVLVLT